jgi:hypothetical protein
MSFLEDLSFAQALMLLAAVYFGGTWGRRYVKFGGTLHERVARLENEVQRLSEETERTSDAEARGSEAPNRV